MTHLAAGAGGHNYEVTPNGALLYMGQKRPEPGKEIIEPPKQPPVEYEVENGLKPPITMPIPENGKTIIDQLIERAQKNPLITIGVIFLIARMTRII